jgi:hypothetical protein
VEACEGVWRRVEACEGVWRRVEACGGVWRRVEACGGVWRRAKACGGVWRRGAPLSVRKCNARISPENKKVGLPIVLFEKTAMRL